MGCEVCCDITQSCTSSTCYDCNACRTGYHSVVGESGTNFCKKTCLISTTVTNELWTGEIMNTCLTCHEYCLSCSQVGNKWIPLCDSCKPGYLYDPVTKFCTKVCDSDELYDADINQCYNCHSKCLTCEAAGEYDCLTCRSDPPNTNVLHFTGTCGPCHEICKTCSGQLKTQCLSCLDDGVYFKDGKCTECSRIGDAKSVPDSCIPKIYAFNVHLATTAEDHDKKALTGGKNFIIKFAPMASWNLTRNKKGSMELLVSSQAPIAPAIPQKSLETVVFPKIDPL